MMMAEGQGNGHDSPERDSAWQPSPPPGGDPGDGTPEPDSVSSGPAAPPNDPGAADSGASWLPFKMTSPAEDAAQAAAAQPEGTPPVGTPGAGVGATPTPDTQPTSGAQPAAGPQPGSE